MSVVRASFDESQTLPPAPVFFALAEPRLRRPAPIRRNEPLRQDALRAKPAGVLCRAIVRQMLVEPDRVLGLAEQLRTEVLPVSKRDAGAPLSEMSGI
jgi:hypothetical protein